jgi:hypothetical protein
MQAVILPVMTCMEQDIFIRYKNEPKRDSSANVNKTKVSLQNDVKIRKISLK